MADKICTRGIFGIMSGYIVKSRKIVVDQERYLYSIKEESVPAKSGRADYQVLSAERDTAGPAAFIQGKGIVFEIDRFVFSSK